MSDSKTTTESMDNWKRFQENQQIYQNILQRKWSEVIPNSFNSMDENFRHHYKSSDISSKSISDYMFPEVKDRYSGDLRTDWSERTLKFENNNQMKLNIEKFLNQIPEEMYISDKRDSFTNDWDLIPIECVNHLNEEQEIIQKSRKSTTGYQNLGSNQQISSSNEELNLESVKNEKIFQKDQQMPEFYKYWLITHERELIEKGISIGKFLYKGGFGVVFEAKVKGMEMAVKIVKEGIPNYEREYSIVSKFSHPNVLTLTGVTTLGVRRLSFMPLADGDLKDLMKRKASNGQILNLETIRNIFRQVIEGVNHIHSHLYSHCDVKERNILLFSVNNRIQAKVSDFDCLKDYNHLVHKPFDSIAGTTSYFAPEILTRYPNSNRSALNAVPDLRPMDVFAIGITLFQCLTLHSPFPRMKSKEDSQKEIRLSDILANNWMKKIPNKREIPKQTIDLLRRLLAIDYNIRQTLSQIASHEFFWMSSGLWPNIRWIEDIRKSRIFTLEKANHN